jgi:gluconate:H+ symporter, GntP family
MNIELLRIVIGLIIAVAGIILATRYLKLHAFFSLLLAAFLFGTIVKLPFTQILTSVQAGFGTLLQQIGIIVACGAVLGMLLEKTGAMESISRGLLNLFGASRSIFAIALIGVIVGIPVFCDSGFIILSRLIPSIAAQAGVPAASLTLALSSGLYTTHTLVPPTPGPLAAASNLGVETSLGIVMLVGIIISIPVLIVSYFFSRYAGAKILAADFTTQEKIEATIPVYKALLPLVIPIILIALSTFTKFLDVENPIVQFLMIIGAPSVALFIGICLALPLISFKTSDWQKWVADALKDAGIILLITGAGGAFGAVIKASGISEILQLYTGGKEISAIALFCLGWFLAAVLKTAQGSTTSAMIITSSLVAPLAITAGFNTSFDLALLVTSIGGGAMCVSHANDSYFWIVSQFGGLAPKDAFKSFTFLTFLQAVTILISVILLSLIF